MRLGIGVTTYNRAAHLAETLERIRRHTKARYELVVGDDGSTDETRSVLKAAKAGAIHGPNRGVAWNKNRLLYCLHAIRRCDVIILLEDDTSPRADGWEGVWIEAAQRWGHANLAADWFAHSFLSGSGSIDDPILSTEVSAQCSSFSRAALQAVGYMDSRFKRFGYEHAEHSKRMLRAGFGGLTEPERFFLIRGDLAFAAVERTMTPAGLDANARMFHDVVGQDTSLFRWPWRSPDDKEALQAEMRAGDRLPGGRIGTALRIAGLNRRTRRRLREHGLPLDLA